jgi:hypothetical protein
MRAFIVVAVLVIPVMLFGVSCKKETPESKELAFERVLQDSMSGQLLYAEAEEHEAGTAYEPEEQEGEDQYSGYESEEEEGEDVGYEPEEEGEDEEPAYESDEDEQA